MNSEDKSKSVGPNDQDWIPDTSDQPIMLSPDERRLLTHYRSLLWNDRSEIYRTIVRKAIARYLPRFGAEDARPRYAGQKFLTFPHPFAKEPESLYDNSDAVLADAVSEMKYCVVELPSWDRECAQEAARKYNRLRCVEIDPDHPGADSINDRITEEDFENFLCRWRECIVEACEEVRSRMATTVKEAESQVLDVPKYVEVWEWFALTIDGDRIAEEMGRESPGRFQIKIDLNDPALTILELRCVLYSKLRLMQKERRITYDLPQDEYEEIQAVLDWIRTRQKQPTAQPKETTLTPEPRVNSPDDDDANMIDAGKYPWEDLMASMRNRRLQEKHPVSEGQRSYLARAKSCPNCGTAADQLDWFYFSSPPSTWRGLCGCAGWATACMKCQLQVDFFEEMCS